MTIEQYIEENGYKVADLTAKELKEVQAEVDAINNGETILDGFFSPTSDFSLRMLG